MSLTGRILACVTAVILAAPLAVQASAPSGPFRPEEIDQLVAPIALYPDPLLAQILMASTYPLDVVSAARFAKENPGLKGDALNEALKKQTWDDSVKSLLSFPEVLAMMDARLEWTQKLGDGFLAQQKDVMDAIQRLRARAHAEGNLKSTPEQKVTVEPAPQTVVVQQAPPTVITIQPTSPQVVYVPTYNPTVVYGAWPYPAYPPAPYYPPGYVAGAAAVSFAAGMAVGAAIWSDCDWHAHDVNINVNQYNNFTNNVNTADVAQKRSDFQSAKQNWQHNPENRKGARYRDPATQQRYAKAVDPQATQARENFRGRAEQGRQELGRAGGERLGSGGAGPGGGERLGPGGAGEARRGGAPSATGTTGGPGSGQARAGAFEGMGQGRDVQAFSNRGQASRQSMTRPAGGVQGGASGRSLGGRRR